MSHQALFTVGFAISVVFIFWTLSSTSSSPFTQSLPRLYNKRICLLIAHPDDEAMFFAPTVLALTKPELGNHLKILCLSTGDADGLGHIRQKELQQSAQKLGLHNESDVFVVEDPTRFPDSMTKTWTEADVASILTSAFVPDPSSSASSSRSKRKATADNNNNNSDNNKAPVATIDVLLTFDRHGVSYHPNHRSLYHGAMHFLRTLMKDKSGFTCPVTLYTLTTTNIVRKYAGVFDAPMTLVRGVMSNLSSALSGGRAGRGSSNNRTAGKEYAQRLLFVSSVNEWMTAMSAMVTAHKSQMVWFRWGWITIGRYMVVNDLKKEKVN